MKVFDVILVILKSGICEYKYLNSKIKLIGYKVEGKKGVIFGFRLKELMMEFCGIVFIF